MAVLNRLLRARGTTTVKIIRSFSSTLNTEIDLHVPPLSLKKPLTLGRSTGDRNVQWVFLGCPGVGKGTYAGRLSSLLGVPHIATGDLVREELASQGPLASELAKIVNQGQLVSDELVIKLLSKHLEAAEDKGQSGVVAAWFACDITYERKERRFALQVEITPGEILNGGIRTALEILEDVTDIDLVINLKLREEALLAKCLGRRICSECGGNYNVACIDIKGENGSPGMYMAPLLPPQHCESKLITRSDDKEEVVKERLRVYNEMSRPLEEFYRNRGKLLEFDLPGGIPESWPKLLRALNLDDDEGKKSAAA
ncbi:hypothetical protein RJ639_034664 [Escallonia herrerae]|uniref:adenylate kinase n=1 Tax=Escallonia herrerae TaxID=1293975 RepID=A0AA89BF69_9ASTE|nr:hypothetical protein RJ639_034664 [Escallonia herrerae]